MVVLFLVLQFLLMEELYSSGVGEIKFLRYEDKSDCLDVNSCDFYFKPLKIQDGNGNTLWSIARTDTTADKANVDLTTVSQLSSPIQINIPTNRTVKIVTTVWDDDTFGDKEVREITDFMVPFSTVSVGDNWKQAIKTSSNPYMKFTVQYKLTQCDGHFTGLGCNFCEKNYFTKLCNKYCVSVVEQYNCTDQGTKLCLGNWNGTECDSCALNYFGTDCSKFCNSLSASYTCNETGNRDCREDYYPAQQCDKFCLAEPSNYTCDNTTGEKICYGKKAGDNCEHCIDNYYPEGECGVLCEPEEGNYTCSDDGEKICVKNRASPDCTSCIENYYGRTCTKFCKETTKYNCSEDGNKICLDNSISIANNCKKGTQQITVWIASGVAAVLFMILILGAFYILQSRRKQKNMSAGNVVYVNTAVPDTPEYIPTAEHNYDNVVLHVTSEDATYIDNTIVLDEATYTYARAEDMARIKK